MPREFAQCVASGGKVITKSNGSEYVHLCKSKGTGQWKRSEVHVVGEKKKKSAAGKPKKKIAKAPRKKAGHQRQHAKGGKKQAKGNKKRGGKKKAHAAGGGKGAKQKKTKS